MSAKCGKHFIKKSIKLKAYAKINLGLRVLAKRPDGYHNLETIMQTVDVADNLEVALGASGLRFECSDISLMEDNLVLKATRAFYRELGLPAAVSIKLHKNIPAQAGLGGGSSDAAATLKALNRLYDLPLTHEQLWHIAQPLGADVPFFLIGGTALCTGRGDQVHPLPDFPLGNYLLVKPPVSLSTARIFALLDIKKNHKGESLHAIKALPITKFNIKSKITNDLEKPALTLYNDLEEIKKELYGLGAVGVSMSGSGSAVFALFERQEQVQQAAVIIKARKPDDWWIMACKGTVAVD